MTQLCPTGKKRHSSLTNAKAAARIFARELNEQGEIAHTMYAYRCDKCRGGWHLTQRDSFGGRSNLLVLHEPPLELQRWAITGVLEIPAQSD